MFKVQHYYREVTPSSGAVSFNTPTIHGEITTVRVRPTTGTTTWVIKITCPNGFTVYQTETETGELNDAGISNDLTLVKGIYTVAISSASVDEKFYVQIDVKQYASQR